ncbi:MAG: ATP-dependent DNA helicase RecQ [Rhodothermales bacterium]
MTPAASPASPTSPGPSRRDATAALRRHWGHEDFRPGQWSAIEAVLGGSDVLAVLPTGGGKSVCYQVPAVLQGGLVVVVSPLVALMRDQVSGLTARGVPATFIDSSLPYHESEQRWTDAEFGRYRLLYLSPERLESETFEARAGRLPTTLLAVDEAHCISEWGHDFRPAYLRIADGAALLGHPPVIAVTATATPDVRRDIVERLGLREPRVIVHGFDRPNVVPSVFRTDDKKEKALEILRSVPGSGIVYASTRRGTETWAETLRRAGFAAEAYHAGLATDTRTAVQQRWQRGETRVIAATSAFGMGIDKPDVRFVLHVDLPRTVEAYYQEAGRAGRDGERAFAVLLFAERDAAAAQSFTEEGHPEAAVVQTVYEAACSLAQLPIGSEPDGPMAVDVETIAATKGLSPMAVRSAVAALARAGAWEVRSPSAHRGLLRFRQPAETVRAYADGLGNAALAGFVRELLRGVHAEAFSGWSDLDLRALERRTNLPRARLLRGLDFLAQHDLLVYLPPGDDLRVAFDGPRSDRALLDANALRASRRRAIARLDEMLRYVRSITCRRHFLLSYFGEASPERCGTCDVCLGRHRPAVVTPEDEPALRRLLTHAARGDDRAAWLAGEALPDHRVDGLADWLVHEGYLRVADPLAGTLALTPKGERFVA